MDHTKKQMRVNLVPYGSPNSEGHSDGQWATAALHRLMDAVATVRQGVTLDRMDALDDAYRNMAANLVLVDPSTGESMQAESKGVPLGLAGV